ncbi:hypothetical protein MPSEU_000595500 [Mayamaea pseudoterrestris]|nr:hypothetical protein MPSEU_000595500 [Mayamaea pseudoterrestris]
MVKAYTGATPSVHSYCVWARIEAGHKIPRIYILCGRSASHLRRHSPPRSSFTVNFLIRRVRRDGAEVYTFSVPFNARQSLALEESTTCGLCDDAPVPITKVLDGTCQAIDSTPP